MSAVKHTPGLIFFKISKDLTGDVGLLAGRVEDGTGPVVIAETFADIRHAGENASEEAVANARRLVACWNACQQFDTEFLERISRPGSHGIHPAPQERVEELLEALIAFRDGGPQGGQNFEQWHQSYAPAIDKARAAIAKATGGAA